jgi:hypothetical protein
MLPTPTLNIYLFEGRIFHKNPLANNQDIKFESLSSDTLYTAFQTCFTELDE